MKPFRGIVTDWEIHEFHEQPQGAGLVFTGTISEVSDTSRFGVGRHIISSQIVAIKHVDSCLEIETFNSIYRLTGEGGDHLLREKGIVIGQARVH